MPTPIKNGTSLSRYRSVWEMRADGWINLVDDLSRLAILPPDDPERARRLAHVHRIVESLTPIESYWAFLAAGCSASCATGSSARSWRARTRPRAASTACWPRAPTATTPTPWTATTSCPRRSRPTASARPSWPGRTSKC